VAGVHTGRDTANVEQERQGDLLSHWKQDDGVDVSGSVDLTLSQPRQLFDQRYVFQNISLANYDVSPDGQRFVMVKDEAGSGRLNVVLNWSEELKRLVQTR
jgi:hypothetical protein